jgi:hypothetical protein
MVKKKDIEKKIGPEISNMRHEAKRLMFQIGGVVLIAAGLCIVAVTMLVQFAIQDAHQIGGLVVEGLGWDISIGIRSFMNTVVGQGLTLAYLSVAAGIVIIIGGIVAIIYSKKV